MSSAILKASKPCPSNSKPLSTEYLCGVIAESLPEATAKDKALAPGPVAANVSDEGGVPMIHMPDSAASGSATYDAVCSRFPAKEIGTATQQVSSSSEWLRERKTMTVGLDVKTSGSLDTGVEAWQTGRYMPPIFWLTLRLSEVRFRPKTTRMGVMSAETGYQYSDSPVNELPISGPEARLKRRSELKATVCPVGTSALGKGAVIPLLHTEADFDRVGLPWAHPFPPAVESRVDLILRV